MRRCASDIWFTNFWMTEALRARSTLILHLVFSNGDMVEFNAYQEQEKDLWKGRSLNRELRFWSSDNCLRGRQPADVRFVVLEYRKERYNKEQKLIQSSLHLVILEDPEQAIARVLGDALVNRHCSIA